MYHTNRNVLLGAPTGSGKTIVAELAMFRVFMETPDAKVVYIGPMKALVQERLRDWRVRLVKKLGKKLVELTGDSAPTGREIEEASVICTTPEKWDGISRMWQQRAYVQRVTLVVIDEIHLLGEDRGPILEVIVSRMRYIAAHTARPIRVVGLSTALANARDVADWLGIDDSGLFNFRPSVRPVPLEVHIQGFPGKHYCPRMATMNKPAYAAICSLSPSKPVLIFVASRRQTRLTAIDLISLAAADEQPRRFLLMSEQQLQEQVLPRVGDSTLRHCLQFGVGLHHAGLSRADKQLAEELFASCKIHVLVCTATLAWGVNLPAHLVIVKGTEYYDGKTCRYVDFPVTDVLQMMGRAGRPQYDDSGKALIMVQQQKKSFYKRFLYEPFPVESSLQRALHDHLNAEIVAETICTRQDAVDYLTWTFLYRRVLCNPSYYGLKSTEGDSVSRFLSSLVESCLVDLHHAHCVELDGQCVAPLPLGRIAAYYYLRYKSVQMFERRITHDSSLEALLSTLCASSEYDELPVRHNEDSLNESMAPRLRYQLPSATTSYASPHVKTNILLQYHFSHLPLPISDYQTDLKSVLDQSMRILQAMIDVAGNAGYLATTLNIIRLLQMIVQGRWLDIGSTLSTLPRFDEALVHSLQQVHGIESLSQLATAYSRTRKIKASDLATLLPSESALQETLAVITKLPCIEMNYRLLPSKDEGKGADNDDASVLEVHLKRLNNKIGDVVHSSSFGKALRENWWLIVGDAHGGALLAMKRIQVLQQTSAHKLDIPRLASGSSSCYFLYLMSGSYIGLDQELEIAC